MDTKLLHNSDIVTFRPDAGITVTCLNVLGIKYEAETARMYDDFTSARFGVMEIYG